jgi:hypothetical protein
MTSNELQARMNWPLSPVTCYSLLVTPFDIFCNAIGGRFVLGTEERANGHLSAAQRERCPWEIKQTVAAF